MIKSPDLEPWESEVLAWLAGLAGGAVERGDRVRIARGPTVAEAFVVARTIVAGAPTEVEVLLRARVETAPGETSAAAEQGPFRSASARCRVRGRPRIALGERFVSGGVAVVEPDRPLPPGHPRLEGVCFASDASDAEVQEVLSAPKLPGRIADLFERGCDSVSINEGGEWLFVRFRRRGAAEGNAVSPSAEDERVRGIVDGFLALSDALPVFVGPVRRRSWPSKLSRALPWVSPLVGFPLTIAGTSWRLPIDELTPVAFAGVGLALWALYLLGLWLFLRRKRRGRLAFRSRSPLGALGLVTFFGLPTSCMGLGLLVNGCDSGALSRHSVAVLSKHRNKSHHYLDVKEFRLGKRGFVRVEAEHDLWERTKPGARVVLVLGPGRLGLPWIARVEDPPPAGSSQRE